MVVGDLLVRRDQEHSRRTAGADRCRTPGVTMGMPLKPHRHGGAENLRRDQLSAAVQAPDHAAQIGRCGKARPRSASRRMRRQKKPQPRRRLSRQNRYSAAAASRCGEKTGLDGRKRPGATGRTPGLGAPPDHRRPAEICPRPGRCPRRNRRRSPACRWTGHTAARAAPPGGCAPATAGDTAESAPESRISRS